MAKTIGPLFTLLVLIAVAALWRTDEATRALQVTALAQTADAAECIAPSRLTLTLGVGDDAETDWSGSATGWVTGDPAWSAESASSPLKRGNGSRTPRIIPADVEIDLPAGPCVSAPEEDRVLQVETAQGSFEVAPLVGMGFKQYALDRRVEVARGPLGVPVADTRMEEDYPDCALLNDGSVLCAYVEFDPGQPVDEQAALAGDFSSIEFDGAGDRVALVRRVGTTWGDATYATGAGRDVWRPAVSALPAGGAAVLWSEQRDGNWDIYARRFDTRSGTLAEEERLTTDPGSDINVVASGGYYAWQGRRGLGFDIFVSRLDGEPALVSSSDANDWRPSIATDSKGAAWIAWDTYDVGNYDVKLRRFDGRELGESIAIAASHRFEARASVAVDQADRVWVAFEDSAEDWGKDAGDRWPGKQASPMYVSKNVLVRVWDGELKQTVGPPIAPRVDYHHDDPFVSTTLEHRISIPRLAFDATGTPWVAFRKHPLQTGPGGAVENLRRILRFQCVVGSRRRSGIRSPAGPPAGPGRPPQRERPHGPRWGQARAERPGSTEQRPIRGLPPSRRRSSRAEVQAGRCDRAPTITAARSPGRDRSGDPNSHQARAGRGSDAAVLARRVSPAYRILRSPGLGRAVRGGVAIRSGCR